MHCENHKTLQLLKTARGQIDGIIKMMEDDRYCIDISNQIMACIALLKKSNSIVLKAHLDHCVKDAILNNTADDKMKEIGDIIEKLTK
ncbi:metal-sensing transcriptional repressor [Hathewaya massiliensis]|uniref:metal-sensing transcriptional repressor n=1 Tax=Hathewaya massiliensis TaxID=1964382 RepID=UPI00115C1955|nr:metal-sensing transcriptional repressor [Hathewaya massiliensis]